MLKPNRHIESTHSEKLKISIIILSAIPSSTIKSYGIESLFKIRSKETLINYQLRTIKEKFKNQDYEIILVSGYQSNKLLYKVPDDVIKIENVQYERTNTAYDLKLGLRACTGNKVIIFNGNTLFNKYIFNFPLTNQSGILIDDYNLDINKHTIGCVSNNKKFISYMSYELSTNKWSGITYISDNDLFTIRHICEKKETEKYFIFEVINEAIDLNCKMKLLYAKDMKTLTIRSIKDLNRIEDILC